MDYRKIFLPPVYDSLERSQKAAYLHFTLIISAAALSLFGFLNLYWNAITLRWLLLGISGLCIGGAILNKFNRYVLAALLFSILGVFGPNFCWRADFLFLSPSPTLKRGLCPAHYQAATGLLSWLIVSTQSESLDPQSQPESSLATQTGNTS